MNISINLIQTLAIAVIFLLIGIAIKNRVKFLRTYFIPTPVIGGLVFALIMLVGHQTSSFSVELDQSLTGTFMIAFFTATGFSFSVKDLKKTGIIGLKLAVLTVMLIGLQNALVPLVAPLVGIEPLLELTMASMSMSGGPGTTGAFGPTLEAMGVENATLVGLSAATYGLVMGSIIGGPVAKLLIRKNKLSSNDTGEEIKLDNADSKNVLNEQSITKSLFIILISMGIGTLLVWLLNKTGFIWPDYVGGLFIAAVARNLFDTLNIQLNIKAINVIGNIALSLFLVLTIMDLEIWSLFNLALPMIISLLIQTVFMIAFAIFVVYRVMGKNYDAAVMSSGMCGVGLGATSNAVANMRAVTEGYGPSPNSMVVLPVIVSVLLSLFNPIIITLFINMLR
ncbi:sodium/glutamate symporter [Terribacillus saccharophilus]|uniref:Sodium/glutamate symporter n=1 Tax=Terribacillus saccharophilus TaxID=361277 RepID=A0A268HCI5_9BACI|nr:sodium/glutamate symporter [Terribacillus saccharophilus]PAE07596.1 sodium/glutamate symporter [Terribacillus saccharophilus]